jgi:hypothetical protein
MAAQMFDKMKARCPVTFYIMVLSTLLFWALQATPLAGAPPLKPGYNSCQPERLPLLNGRIWHNQYSKVTGDQFFLTNSFMKGYVIFNGIKYTNLDLQFDIANDELILKPADHPIIMINKEMVDSFCISDGYMKYYVINAGYDTTRILRGYVNVLYNGPTTLYVKFSKKVQPLGADGKNDLLIEERKIFVRHDDQLIVVTGNKVLLELFGDKKMQVTNFIKSNKIKISRKKPFSYIPVLKYYDSMMK